MGGILETIAGGFAEPIGTPPPVGTGDFGGLFDLAFNSPQLMQLFSLAYQLGESPSALISPYLTEISGPAQADWGSDPTKLLIQTKDKSKVFLDMDKLSGALPDLQSKLQEKAIANFGDTYAKLAAVPALSGIFAEAGGDTSAFNQQFSNIFDSMAGAALGTAAPNGFLNDKTVQANVLGPTALNKAIFEKQLQQNAQAQALSLSGAGALPGLTTLGGMTNPSMMSFQPGVFNAANLGFQASAQNAQNFLQQQALQLQQYMAADQSLWNVTSLFGGIGGGGGGGGGGISNGSGGKFGGMSVWS